MKMVERIARADAAFAGRDFDGFSKADKRRFLDRAVVILKAMREPTDAMRAVEGVHWGYGCNVCGGLQEGWYAMIDAAIKEAEAE